MEEDIAFAFNNPNFSDRTLTIKVELPESDLPRRARKKVKKADSTSSSTTLHISSLVLASKSPFFYKMFSNGMRESEQHAVSLSVKASEESALIDLLKFMYTNTLNTTTPGDLFKVLVLADRYQVAKCVMYCAEKLCSFPMTFKRALSCLNLPSTILEGDNAYSHLHSLMDAAKYFLSKNFSSYYENALELITLESLENILSWDSLQVDSEDEVFDIVLAWAKTHYKDLNQRCEVFSSRLCHLIRFPYISREKLKMVLDDEELEQDHASRKVVEEAVISSVEKYQTYANISSICPCRAYNLRRVEVMELDSPYQESIVYWNLTKEDCFAIAEDSKGICTKDFRVGNEYFFLEFGNGPEDGSVVRKFGIVLWRYVSDSPADVIRADIEVAVRRKVIGTYTAENKHSCAVQKGGGWFLAIGRTSALMDEDSHYFENGVMHVRVTVTLK